MAGIIDPTLFDQLKAKLEEDTKVRQDMSDIVDELSKQVAFVQGLLSRVHSTPRAQCKWHEATYSSNLLMQIPDPAFLRQVDAAISEYKGIVTKLSTFASDHPYYK